MKMMHTYISRLAILLGMTLMLCCACSNDDSSEQHTRQEREFHFIPCWQTLPDINASLTRSIPTGYDLYSGQDPVSIRGYITTSNRIDFYGDFTYDGEIWSSKVPIDDDTYYIYGLMPSLYADNISVRTRTGDDFANGATLTLSGLDAVMADDICIITGVAKSENRAEPTMELGKFSYTTTTTAGGHNYVYLLLDHLYAALHFKISIDNEYSKLRTIKVKSMKLTPEAESSTATVRTVDATVTLTPTSDGSTPMALSFTNQTGEGKGITLYPENPTEAKDFYAYIAPLTTTASNRRFLLECTYDVYDSKGTLLVRENETSKNYLTLNSNTLLSGERYMVEITVIPTYLYVLSDPDLDNPTFILSN